jgi:pimeloyl-ACP methyl ester carboxylesterase
MQHILLLHGALGSRQQLDSLAKALGKYYTVHQLNFSGHGDAAMPHQFSITIFANDVLTYLASNKIEKTHIFGYSMGGYVALYIALHYPEKVSGVFTLATKFAWTPAFAANEVKQLQPGKITEKVPAFAQHLEQIHQPNQWKEVVEKTAVMMQDLGNNPALNMQELTKIKCAVQVAVGDKDAMVTLEETVEVFKHLPDVRLQVMPNTKHPIEKVNANYLAEDVYRFFASLGV